MSKFDLERAKAGEPIEIYELSENAWSPAHFVGLSTSGSVVIQSKFSFWTPTEDYIRMAPKKVTVRYRVALYKRTSGSLWTCTVDNAEEEKEYSREPRFVAWLTEWQTAEIQLDLTDKETR